ncbi:barstar family protein [Kitasatospora cineracea]|uniref:barstar family protein n=1 Tax=Kitasatospora cineracea TaxID=88074 RepID=UPI00368F9A45
MNPIDVEFRMYRVVEIESGTVLASAGDLRGFFINPGDLEFGNITLVNPAPISPNKMRSQSAELQIINLRHDKVGAYYLGQVRLGRSGLASGNQDLGPVEYSFAGYRWDYPWAGRIWQRWATGGPIVCGEWAGYPSEHHRDWLHVVQTSWFETRSGPALGAQAKNISIDGSFMPTRSSFYCALGESMNGPGGYFGSNLDALIDCLRGVRGGKFAINVTWENFSAAIDSLGEGFVKEVISIFGGEGVHVRRK